MANPENLYPASDRIIAEMTVVAESPTAQLSPDRESVAADVNRILNSREKVTAGMPNQAISQARGLSTGRR